MLISDITSLLIACNCNVQILASKLIQFNDSTCTGDKIQSSDEMGGTETRLKAGERSAPWELGS